MSGNGMFNPSQPGSPYADAPNETIKKRPRGTSVRGYIMYDDVDDEEIDCILRELAMQMVDDSLMGEYNLFDGPSVYGQTLDCYTLAI